MPFFHSSPVSVSFSGRSDEPLLGPAASPSPSSGPRLSAGPAAPSAPATPARLVHSPPTRTSTETHLQLTNNSQDRRHQRHQSLESSVNNLALRARVEQLERENKALKAKAKRWDTVKKLVCQSRLARGAEDDARFRASVEGMVERDLLKKEKKGERAFKEKKSVAERVKGLFKSTKKTKET
ncbi:uncharacterized protein BKA78DRAFT_340715 [Phyllosticta capitalensis]|uniref:uncharacterized protein n=1 Tax=Phyllosticta capitalensis TaxID=121624 RepID=UPI0031307932